MNPAMACAAHPELPASHGCDGCGRGLCPDCVQAGTHLLFCAHCGEQALPLVGAPKAARADLLPTAKQRPERYRPEASHVGFDDLASLFCEDIVVPAAIIAMVTALLFYLLELREVLFGVNTALKQIGFCFVAATVLIARHGKGRLDRQREEAYTGFLVVATLIAMIALSGSFPGMFFNLAVVTLIWRFASRLTRGLSLDLREPPPKEGRLYGLERLEMERQTELLSPARPRSRDGADKARNGHGNPSSKVARLALLALLAFALGEPLLVKAAPIVAQRAMAAVVVFLFATALVLAAGSAAASLRQVRRDDGLSSPYIVPSRIAVGGLLAALVLSMMLVAPGVSFLGQGGLRNATSSESRVSARGESSAASDAASAQPDHERKNPRAAEEKPTGDQERSKSRQSRAPPSGPAGTLLQLLSSLGRLLLPIALLILALAGLYLAIRHGGMLRAFAAKTGQLLGNFWARLRALSRRRAPTRQPPLGDPFSGLEELARLPPREATLAAYARLLTAFEQAGHARFERQTPGEFLASIPGRLRELEAPTADLTSLYLRAAYSSTEPPPDSGQAALGHLQTLAERLDSQRPS